MGRSKIQLYKDYLTEDGLNRLEDWARQGLTQEDIAHNIGITSRTLRRWMTDYPEMRDAIKRGNAPVDYKVENALYKNAIGFFVTEKTVEVQVGEDGTKHQVQKEYRRYIKPDTTAQIFWLKNRRPDIWRDRREHDVDVKGAIANPYDELSVDELRKLASLDTN